jgi:hypothetical protein
MVYFYTLPEQVCHLDPSVPQLIHVLHNPNKALQNRSPTGIRSCFLGSLVRTVHENNCEAAGEVHLLIGVKQSAS